MGPALTKSQVQNWERIRKHEANSILIASYKDAVQENLPWIQQIQDHLEKNGLLSLFINEYPEAPYFICKKLYKNLVDQFFQNSFADIRLGDGKLRTYALIKTQIGLEKYLVEVRNVRKRIQITKLRLSDHNLMIEKGRYKKLKSNFRFCPFCKNKVETEMHFLLDCPIYKYLRSTIFDTLISENPFFQYFSKEEKFSYILSNANFNDIATFILKCFELRNFLSLSPKCLD